MFEQKVELLQNAMTDKSIGLSIRDYAKQALGEIGQYGSDSIVHLCLPVYTFNALRHNKIHTIPEAKEKLRSASYLSGFEINSINETRDAIDVFERQLAEAAQTHHD